ncbi:MAG: helix-hairpin-helix domain-containing protein, partial [Thermoplasmatota archaeon]
GGYRTFNMKKTGEDAVALRTATVSRGRGREVDDPASLKEALLRRVRGLQERGEALPDLFVMDGGATQLAAAHEALGAAGLSVPLCSLAKEEELVHQVGRLRPLRLPRSDAGLQLLQRVRDEAHRFGITQVQRKAVQKVTASPLDGVPGIGPKRRQALVRAFAGMEGLRAASATDLQRVPGITAAMAAQIVEVLSGS